MIVVDVDDMIEIMFFYISELFVDIWMTTALSVFVYGTLHMAYLRWYEIVIYFY